MNNKEIPILSIRQPWADLIVSGKKDIENRSWPTKFRGSFYIHAGKAKMDELEICDIERRFHVRIDRLAMQYGGHHRHGPDR